MGYLGLDETPVKDDNLFQRLFWPSDHAGETDYLGQQGFWVCWAVAVFSFLVSVISQHWIIGLFTLVVFGLGGIGVREHSQPAAIIVAIAYWTDQIFGLWHGRFPGFFGLAAGVLLLANIRGTYIAAKWAAMGDAEVFPERSSETFKDRFVDQMPMKVWPRAKAAFFGLSAVYLALLVLGVVVTAMGLGARPHGAAVNEPSSKTLEVSPSR